MPSEREPFTRPFTTEDGEKDLPERTGEGMSEEVAKVDNTKRSAGTKRGMAAATLRGTHCGRYLAFCFSDEVQDNMSRIQTDRGDGHRPTVIVSVDTVLDFARQGVSLPKAASTLGVSRETLKRAMCRKGIDDRYYGILSEVGSKGSVRRRVPNPNENALEGEGD